MNLFSNFMLGVPLIPDSLNPLSTSTLPSMPEFISGFFTTLVTITASVAVLMIAYWGLAYMLNNIPGVKLESKTRLKEIFFGLLLAISAYLILETINPDIIESLNRFVVGK